MASVVCQGLQTCLEPRLTESIVLTTKLSSKPTHFQENPELKANSNNGESVEKNNGWGFFNVLENPTSKHVEHEEVYVHPMVKRSASALSSMSLDMCTESLGTETGSDVSESSDEFNWEERERFGSLLRSKAKNFDRKMLSHRRGGGGFPPPLTSMSGSEGTVKVRPHREGGRLVMKAVSVSVSDCGIKFETERTNGRLSLSLLRDCCVNVESRRSKSKNEGGEEECCDGGVEDGGIGCWGMDGNRKKVGSKTKVRSLKQKSRLPNPVNSFGESTEFGSTKCKDNGNKGIGNWSLFRVVIS